MSRVRVIPAVFALGLIACGDNIARPRVSKVEKNCVWEGEVEIESVQIGYSDDDDTIKDVSYIEDGETWAHGTVSYRDELVESIMFAFPSDPDEMVEILFAYDDNGDLIELAAWEKRKVETLSYQWEESQLVREEFHEDGKLYGWQEFNYLGNQLDRVENYPGDFADWAPFHYTFNYIDEQLYRISSSWDAHGYDDNEFKYDSDGRLVAVVDGEDDTYRLRYNGDGLLSEVTRPGEYRCTTRYTYEDGEVKGIIPVPEVPWGNLFDLSGYRLPRMEVMTTALFD